MIGIPEHIPRVGRKANPAEATKQLATENPEVLRQMAKNLFGHESELFGMRLTEAWNALNDKERENWEQAAMAIIDENVRTYREE
jgi:hypothetical protein